MNPSRDHRSILWVVLVVTAAHLGLLLLFVSKHNGDLSAAAQVSEDRAQAPEFSAITYPLPAGHDGQFYYLLAQNPFAPARADLLDQPARHTRVLYPLLGWIASGGGNPRLLILALPLINLLAVAATGWLGASFAVQYGRPAWYGLFLPCALASAIALVHDLTDAVSGLFVAALVAAALREKDRWIGPLALLALLAKEQNAAIVGMVGLLVLWQRRWSAVAGLAVAGALWLGWVAWVSRAYGGAAALPPTGDNFAIPFAGLWWRLTHLGQIVETDRASTRRAIFHVISVLYHLGLVGVVVWMLFQPMPWLVRGLGLIGAVLVLTAGRAIYGGLYDSSRVFVLAPLAVWFAATLTGRPWLLWVVAPGALWGLYTAMGWA
ncbi:MAG: hypothetical protein ACKO23_03115 [Gemmataceae bacterium]